MHESINEGWDDFEKTERSAEITEAIETAGDFDELINNLDALGRIQKEDGTVYSADELVSAIESVRSGKEFLGVVTRAFGLREKVGELFVAEQIANAQSLDELKQNIDVVVAVTGGPLKSNSGEEIPTEELKTTLQMVIEQGINANFLTRRYGLREKAESLQD